MTLKEFLKDCADPEGFAIRCNTSIGHLRQVSGGHRRASAQLCIDIERESAGAIPCETTRPDIDWAYLRKSKSTDSTDKDNAA